MGERGERERERRDFSFFALLLIQVGHFSASEEIYELISTYITLSSH